MKIKNEISGTKEEFVPINKNKITMYVCGPTVYNFIHLGNARSCISFDIIYRYFLYKKYDVNYIQNITDIDDKIINKAILENKQEKDISEKYYEAYIEDLKRLNIKIPTKIVKVSENMDFIISFIEKLIKNNFAYISGDDVYFDVSKISQYGLLSKQNLEKLKQNVRIENNKDKKNFFDFALWKKTNIGITWKASFGEGRPGWHTECVALINKYGGDFIDIHGGGIDLCFPHHENEIAQQIAFKNTLLAKYWIHNGHLNINFEKMSKSLGNTILVKDFVKEHGSNILRYIFCLSNYTSPMNIEDNIINQSKKELLKIYQIYYIFKYLPNIKNSENDKESLNHFEEIMDNNFSTANVLTFIQEIIKKINVMTNNFAKENINNTKIRLLFNSFEIILETLGFKFENKFWSMKESEELDKFFEAWNKNNTNLTLKSYKSIINMVINKIN